MKETYKKRRKRLQSLAGDSLIIIPSGEIKTRSRDQHHPFSVDTDFLYFTGIDGPCESGSYLVLSDKEEFLFAPELSKLEMKWNGKRQTRSGLSKVSGVSSIQNIANFESAISDLAQNKSEVCYPVGVDSALDQSCMLLFSSFFSARAKSPHKMSDIRHLTAQMRIKKDKTERAIIAECCKRSARAFEKISCDIGSFHNELELAAALEAGFFAEGLESAAFQTIVASGSSATILHHQPQSKNRIQQSKLVLIDSGARYLGYCSDISRTYSPSGTLTSAQDNIYQIVNSALDAAIEHTRHGVSFKDVSKAAEKVLSRGLRSLKIKEPLRKYFPHGIGHHLGLDVHDVTPIPAPEKLETGNVITLEPGLYFDPRDSSVPKEYRGIGVRIEEDVCVTSRGCDVLTKEVKR